jgi:diguanylate cyclase (GGDEF)-like protein
MRRQIKQHFGDNFAVPEKWQDFINAVNNAYWESDADRSMLERALDLSSQELLQSNSEMRAVMQAFPDVFIWFDYEGTILGFKAGSTTNLHPAADNLVGSRIQEIQTGDVGNRFYNAIVRVRKESSITSIEYSLVLENKERFFEARMLPLLENKIFSIIRDITERKIMEERLRHLSLHDTLTGLYNRAYFEEEMRRLESGRFNPVGIVLCDVDGLKLVNDTLGHESGDCLLIEAANVIKKAMRQGDMVARIGGDEFAALLPHSDLETVEGICYRIRDAIKDFNTGCSGLTLSISLGYSVADLVPNNMGSLFKEADDNMYREKMMHRQSASSAIVKTLMKALEERDFFTEGHADRLQRMVESMAGTIGMSSRGMADLRLLAQFHDIGKVGIPDRVLFKPGPLTADETKIMNMHCEIGYHISQSAAVLMDIGEWIHKHHEWWNGEGYPMGLKGEEIPLECRILSLADAYDAMTSSRPYRTAMTHQEAVAEITKYAGSQFDPNLVPSFLKILEKEAI